MGSSATFAQALQCSVCVLRMVMGSSKSSGKQNQTEPQATQIETSDDVTHTTSALRENIAQKGEHSYYYAHTRKFDVPPDAKVVSGPGLITGGPPVKLSDSHVAIESVRQETIRDFSWADDGALVKIYIQLPPGTVGTPTCDFSESSLSFQVDSEPVRYVCKIEPFNADVIPSDCRHRLNDKGKVTVTLKKKRNTKWQDLTKKIS